MSTGRGRNEGRLMAATPSPHPVPAHQRLHSHPRGGVGH
uniref:Uncharacterized protein n=1 Tax=Arundo donax TaxID=35708 RepID=A0A0A9G3G8_ARUDO